MKVSYRWLQKEYFDEELPLPKKVKELLTMHAFEIEGLEEREGDTVFDVKVLPDRSHDCLSHLGIAREISLLSGVKLKSKIALRYDTAFPESNIFRADVEDPKLCPRFSALVIQGVEVRESPLWLKESLESIGQRSINNIVDATNYVMFSLGQPLHAYDRERLVEKGGEWKIVVRKARDGEKLQALDDKEYELTHDQLVIVDGYSDTPLGIAGIKGGKASEISKSTKNIILEAANFDPILVRQTAKRLGLRTDASIRFENAISPELTTQALGEVTKLILDIATTDSIQVEGIFDFYPQRPNLYKVGVSLSEIRNILGVDLTQKDVEVILNRRGYEWKYVDPREIIKDLAPRFLGVPYKYGASVVYDSPRSFDCSSFSSFLYANAGIRIPRVSIEQFLFGAEVLEGDLRPGDLVFSKGAKPYFFKEEPRGIGHVGVYIGDGKVIHASGSSHFNKVEEENLKESDSFNPEVFRGFRRLISDDERRFVVTIPPERLDLRIKEDLVEEIGRIHGYSDLVARPIDVVGVTPELHKKTIYADKLRNFFIGRGFSEVITYVFQKMGEEELQNPLASDKKYLRIDLREGLSEALLRNAKNADLLGLEQIKLFEIGNVFKENNEYTAFAFGIHNTKDYKGVNVAQESEVLISELEKELGISVEFFEKDGVFEINFDSILPQPQLPEQAISYRGGDAVQYKNFSPYPFVLRDIAVFVPEGGDHTWIIDTVKEEFKDLLVQARLFDVFTKEFPEGKKTSYAYRLVFQSLEKTLTDEEINTIMDTVTKKLSSRDGWLVR